MVHHHMAAMVSVLNDSLLGFVDGSQSENVCSTRDSPTDVHRRGGTRDRVLAPAKPKGEMIFKPSNRAGMFP